MKTIRLLLLLGVFTALPLRAENPPPQWEFKVVPLSEIRSAEGGATAAELIDFRSGLNDLGSLGWQLVTITELKGRKIAIFQKPR